MINDIKFISWLHDHSGNKHVIVHGGHMAGNGLPALLIAAYGHCIKTAINASHYSFQIHESSFSTCDTAFVSHACVMFRHTWCGASNSSVLLQCFMVKCYCLQQVKYISAEKEVFFPSLLVLQSRHTREIRKQHTCGPGQRYECVPSITAELVFNLFREELISKERENQNKRVVGEH